jgi:hypothetical protein
MANVEDLTAARTEAKQASVTARKKALDAWKAQDVDEANKQHAVAKVAAASEKEIAAMEAAAADQAAAATAAGQLGGLIRKLNPYTNTKIKDTKRSRGEMTIIDPENVEMEGPYAQEWTFKGQPQRVGMAARIKYKYPVRNEDSEILFWVEDYVLIGFQGSMGG